MLRVGLTGGIGSGKSEVSRRLADRGAAIVDADVAARNVVEPGTPGLGQIAAVFGSEVLQPNGHLDRERLGQIVFAQPDLRAELNAIVHPLVHERMHQMEQEAIAAAGTAGPAGPAGPARWARRPSSCTTSRCWPRTGWPAGSMR